jgi:hypothetical protein
MLEHQAMVRRSLTPSQWSALSRAEQTEILAHQMAVNEKRARIIAEIVDKMPNEFGMLAQALIMALD